MAQMEIGAPSAICRRCGISYSRLKGYFPTSHGALYKGTGYLPYCRDCVESIYADYLKENGLVKNAVRQTCRKLDVYWNEKEFDTVDRSNSNRSVMTAYLVRMATPRFAGNSYDDTLKEENSLWLWPVRTGEGIMYKGGFVEQLPISDNGTVIGGKDMEISDDVIEFWGPGYTKQMYIDLEQRRKYWIGELLKKRMTQEEIDDVGVQALLRQICNVEIVINRDRAAGKPIDKSVNTLNTLLGSAQLKPAQGKDDSTDAATDNTPFGVWIRRWEDQRPLPDVDPEMQDVDGIVRYITVWFFGHLCHMLNIRNSYCKMYEDEIARLRVDRPELDDEDDDSVLNDIFGRPEDDGDEE